MNPILRTLILAADLTTANFLYEALVSRYEWDVAIERSYFQIIALLVAVLTGLIG